MAPMKLIILLLPSFVLSDIRVQIDVTKNLSVNVTLSGSRNELLTDKDRDLFQIRDHELTQGLHRLAGAPPYYVEVGSPYNNQMHSLNSWEIVRRKIVPIESKIRRKETRELVGIPEVYPARNYYPISNNDLWISSQWHAGQYMSSDPILYSFSLDQGNQDLNFKNRTVIYAGEFGKTHNWNSGVKPGSGIRSDISLNGKQVAMHVKQMVLEIEIKYELSLHGQVGSKFNKIIKGSYHWVYDVNACLIVTHRPTKKYVSEVISVVFYYDEVFRLAT